MVPIFSILLSKFWTDTAITMDALFPLSFKLAVLCGFLALYIYLADSEIRRALFKPEAEIPQMIRELNDDSTHVTRLGVMLRSLLSDASLVEEVWSPKRAPGIGGPEREEIDRSEKLFQDCSKILLRRPDPRSEAPLEEDVLRIAVLESLGGETFGTIHPETDERHYQQINEWIGLPTLRGTGSFEHLSVPLVRGLCVFVGGFGQALAMCSSPTDPAWGDAAKLPRPASTWTLSPSTFLCLDFAVTALARLIVRSLTPSGRTLCDWKSSVLSNQVPVALKALHRLRTGIAKYSASLTNDQTTGRQAQLSTQIGTSLSSPVHLELVRVCDASASQILHSMKHITGFGRIDLLLDSACLEWKNDLMGARRGS